jgi:hypothetical protein
MKTTLINDTIVEITMVNFEEHTHDRFLQPTPHDVLFNRQPKKPFQIAYITLTSNEKVQPIVDKIECAVSVHLTSDYRPALRFKPIVVEEHDENDDDDMGGFTEGAIINILSELEDEILYDGIQEIR